MHKSVDIIYNYLLYKVIYKQAHFNLYISKNFKFLSIHYNYVGPVAL